MRIPRTDDIREVDMWRLSVDKKTVEKHNLLSVTHEDTNVGNPVDGDIIIAKNGKWTRLPKGTNGQVLKMVNGLPTWVTEMG